MIKKFIKKIPNEITDEWLKTKIDDFCNNIEYYADSDIVDNRGVKEFTQKNSYYENQIYNTYNISQFEPELEFCETNDQREMWMYFRLKISSFRFTKSKGRNINILIRDKTTKKYIGIASLTSDVLGRKLVNDYIGWNRDYEIKKSIHLMNISTCVGIPPFCFNYNGGKLVAMLMFSKEVYDYYFKKYNDPLVCLVTLSLYGKSVQYDRLKELKFLGYTEGIGSGHVPEELCKSIDKFIETHNLPVKKFKSRLHKITYVCKFLKTKNHPTKHGTKRGVYIGFTNKYDISKKYLTSDVKEYTSNLKSVEEIGKYWKERWAINRFNHLLNNNKIMIKATFDNNLISENDYQRVKQNKYNELHKPKKKTNELSDIEINQIIKYWIDNNRDISYYALEQYFTDKFKRIVSRKKISLLLNP